MALAGSVTGIYEPTFGGTPLTLTRSDVFFGDTPKAALVTYFQVNQGGGDYNTAANGICYGYGAVAQEVLTSDRQWALGVYNEDGVYTTDTSRRIQWGSAICLPHGSSGLGALMTADLVANGITLTADGTWNGANGDIVIEVTLIGGDDFQAYIPPTGLKTSQTTQSGIPFLPNLAMYGQSRSSNATTTRHGQLSQGFVFDNGVDTAVQRTRAVTYPDGAGDGEASTTIFNDRFSSSDFNSTQLNKMVHTNFDSDGGGNYEHNFYVQSVNNFNWGALYMRFDNEDVSLVDIDVVATGSFTKDDYGFNPAVTKVWGDSSTDAWNTDTDDENRAGCLFDWTIEGSGNSVALFQEDNADPINTNSRMVLGSLQNIGDPQTDGYRGYGAHRIEGGFEAEFTQVSVLALKTFSLAFGTAPDASLNISLGDTPISQLYLGDTLVTRAYLGDVSLGGAGLGWTDEYSDVEPADDSGSWSTSAEATLTEESGGLQYTQTANLGGFEGISLDATVEVGRDYRITLEFGAIVGGLAGAIRSGSAVDLTPAIIFTADGTSVLTCKAIDTTMTIALLSASLGASCLIKSVLVEVL